MTKQSDYEVEDFLLDESFIAWVLNDSEKDALFWKAWIAAHPGCLPAVNSAKQTLLVLHVKATRNLTEPEIDSIINGLQQRQSERKYVRNKFVLKLNAPVFSWSLAAMILVGMVIGFFFFKTYKSPTTIASSTNVASIKRLQNNTKSTMLLKLADGSSIILKPGASVSFPNPFSNKNRDVSLNGEAFFEVHKDSAHPFVVHSGDWVTRVVGTSFTIKACNKTKAFKVIVNTGKVMVYKNTNDMNVVSPAAKKLFVPKPVVITPNQQVIYNLDQKNLVKENTASPLMLSPDQSKELFTFHDTPLSKVIANIERAYDVNITYNEKQIGGCPLTAALGDEHLLEKLDLISKALDVHYTINGGQILIRGTGCNTKYPNQ